MSSPILALARVSSRPRIPTGPEVPLAPVEAPALPALQLVRGDLELARELVRRFAPQKAEHGLHLPLCAPPQQPSCILEHAGDRRQDMSEDLAGDEKIKSAYQLRLNRGDVQIRVLMIESVR